MAPAAIRLDETDNVATAVRALEAGEDVLGILASERIPRGHKVALRAIAAGEPVVKYGQFIGSASTDIAAGVHVHTQNVEFANTSQTYEFSTAVRDVSLVEPDKQATFEGFRRKTGKSSATTTGAFRTCQRPSAIGCANSGRI